MVPNYAQKEGLQIGSATVGAVSSKSEITAKPPPISNRTLGVGIGLVITRDGSQLRTKRRVTRITVIQFRDGSGAEARIRRQIHRRDCLTFAVDKRNQTL